MTTNQNHTSTDGSSDALQAERPFLAPLGWFWILIRDTLLVALMIGIVLVVSGRVAASLAFIIPAIWTALFIGSMGFILGNTTRAPLSQREKVFVLLAVLLKIALFIAGAAGVLLSLQKVQADPSLAIWVLVGLHLLPILALLSWVVRSLGTKESAGESKTSHQDSSPGMKSEPSLS